MTTGCTVIVSTYRRPDALQLVLEGLRRQDDDDFEVLVADDGSGEATRAVVEPFEHDPPGRGLRHVWQPDEGFRLARVRNLAAREADGERLVFLDGDCIPRRGFVRGHRRCRPGRATCGRRALLSERTTRRTIDALPDVRVPDLVGQAALRLRGGINRMPSLTDHPLARFEPALSWRRFRGMNHGVHRSDYEAVGGNDQSFEGWGYEDSDLAIRLGNHGVRLIPAGRGSTVLHLWHPEADRTLERENLRRLEELQRSGRIRARLGIDPPDEPTDAA